MNNNNKSSVSDEAPIELDLSTFLYETFDVSDFIDVKHWSRFFDAIPLDPYIKEGYRYKSIAWFRIKHQKAVAINGIDEHIAMVNRLSGMNEDQSKAYLSNSEPTWKSEETGYWCWNLPQYAMQQSILYNPVHGDMRREYSPIDKNVSDSAEFRKLLLHYATYFGWKDAIVLMQFQRVDCSVDRAGIPTIEGFHQDGNRHVGMLIVDRTNITDDSGVSQYAMDQNGKRAVELIFNEVVIPGKLIYWNDKRVWHYGTDIKVKDAQLNGGRGVRDIIILSAKTPPSNMPMGPVPLQFRN